MEKTSMKRAGFGLIIAGVAVLMLLVVSPSMAYSADVQISSQDQGITPSFSMSIAPGDQVIPLSIGTNTLSGNVVDVETNSAYTIKSRDHMLYGKTVGTEGKMVAHAGVVWSTVLTNAFQVGFNGGAYSPMTGTDTLIYTGAAGTVSSPLLFKQVVVPADPVLPTGTVYSIGVTVTGASTP